MRIPKIRYFHCNTGFGITFVTSYATCRAKKPCFKWRCPCIQSEREEKEESMVLLQYNKAIDPLTVGYLPILVQPSIII